MVTGLVVATPAEAAPRATVKVSRTSVMPGERFSVVVASGTRVRRPVVLKYRAGSSWRSLRATTDARGVLRTTTSTTRARVDYRAVLPATTVRGKRHRALSTRTVTVRTVRPAADTTVRVTGGQVRVAARVTPARTGRQVSLQRRDGSTWRTVVAGRPGNAAGRVDFGVVGTQRDLTGRAFRVVAGRWKGAPQVSGAAQVVPALPTPPPPAEPEEPLDEPDPEPTEEPLPPLSIAEVAFEVDAPDVTDPCTSLIVTKTDYVRGRLTVRTPGGARTTVGARLRVRGNSTAEVARKRPYKVKLDDKAALLGGLANRSKDWVLLANHFDRSLMRNDVAMQSARLIGAPWAPRLESANLRINGTLCGVYQIGEGIEAEQGRAELGAGDTLLEADTNDDIDPEFRTSRGLRVFLKDGDPGDTAQVHETFQEVEDLLYAEDFPHNGYRDRIDVDSFVTMYLLNEFSKNNDSAFRNSVYMVLRADGTLAMGPPWDYDSSFGRFRWYLFGIEHPTGWFTGHHFRDQILADNPDFLGAWPTQLWNEPQGHYYVRLLSDPWFADQVRQRWNEVVEELRTLPSYVDARAEELASSATANFTPAEAGGAGQLVWATPEEDGIYWNVFHNPAGVDPEQGWRTEVGALRDWIAARTAWMDEQLGRSDG